MSDSYQTSKKLRSHAAHLCKLSGLLIFIVFCVGCIFSIFDRSFDNLGSWRINFQVQLMERSHLPLISVALYALGLGSTDKRKYKLSVYWKWLTVASSVCVLIYFGSLANSSHRLYSLVGLNYNPEISYENDIQIVSYEVNKITSISEARKALQNTLKRSGKSDVINEKDNLGTIKDLIIKLEKNNLLKRHEKQNKEYQATLRSMRFESIRYVLYSVIFIIFYFNLSLFFNRLLKHS